MQLAQKVKNISNENVLSCYQCGMCSGSCPMRFAMDFSPSQVIRLVQFGLIERILSSNTYWICSTCFACSARCPQEIDVAKIMDALRQIELRRIDTDNVNINQLSKEELKRLPPIALISNFRKTTI